MRREEETNANGWEEQKIAIQNNTGKATYKNKIYWNREEVIGEWRKVEVEGTGK